MINHRRKFPCVIPINTPNFVEITLFDEGRFHPNTNNTTVPILIVPPPLLWLLGFTMNDLVNIDTFSVVTRIDPIMGNPYL